MRFLIAPGQSHDILAAATLLKDQTPEAVLANQAYDANRLCQHLKAIGAHAGIPLPKGADPAPSSPLQT